MREEKPIGKQIVEASKDRSGGTLDMREIVAASEKEHLGSLLWCGAHAAKKVPCMPECPEICKTNEAMTGDFYVEVLVKKETIFDQAFFDGTAQIPTGGVMKIQQMAKKACPTPFFDQTLYRYNADSGDLTFLWVVPDIDTCIRFYENQNLITSEVADLAKFILQFLNGDLHRLCQKLNGEEVLKGTILTKV